MVTNKKRIDFLFLCIIVICTFFVWFLIYSESAADKAGINADVVNSLPYINRLVISDYQPYNRRLDGPFLPIPSMDKNTSQYTPLWVYGEIKDKNSCIDIIENTKIESRLCLDLDNDNFCDQPCDSVADNNQDSCYYVQDSTSFEKGCSYCVDENPIDGLCDKGYAKSSNHYHNICSGVEDPSVSFSCAHYVGHTMYPTLGHGQWIAEVLIKDNSSNEIIESHKNSFSVGAVSAGQFCNNVNGIVGFGKIATDDFGNKTFEQSQSVCELSCIGNTACDVVISASDLTCAGGGNVSADAIYYKNIYTGELMPVGIENVIELTLMRPSGKYGYEESVTQEAFLDLYVDLTKIDNASGACEGKIKFTVIDDNLF